jgi:hypothetical protein
MESPDVNTQQESSPAPVQDSSEVLASLTPEQRGEWRNTGKLPEQPNKQESAPADTSKETESVTSPDAETGKTTQEHKTESKRAPGAEERIRELVAQKKELERKLAERAIQRSRNPRPKQASSQSSRERSREIRPTQ